MSLDFKGLASHLLSQARSLCMEWLPGGKMNGVEYECSNLSGGRGDSLKVNTKEGVWTDFADNGTGGADFISLYAAIHHLDQGEAAKKLADAYNFSLKNNTNHQEPYRPEPEESDIILPPINAAAPEFTHPKHGAASSTWKYKTRDGKTAFYIARYENDDKKQFCPWSWSKTKNKWVAKAFPEPRPLYNLDQLQFKSKPVLVVEGEKAAIAAEALLGSDYTVTTWPGGAAALSKIDLSPLMGHDNILLWPDADVAGWKAMQKIANLCYRPSPARIKIVDTRGEAEGHDIADLLTLTTAEVIAWAKARVFVYTKPETINPEVVPLDEAPAIEDSADEIDIPSAAQLSLSRDVGLATNGRGSPICNMDNVLRIFERYEPFKGLVWFDEFHFKFFTNKDGPTREWTDRDDLALLQIFQREFGMLRLPKSAVNDAVQLFASRNPKNEPKDWISSLTWDGVERVENFFERGMGAVVSEYLGAVSRNFWISMVARIFRPGCKVDTMVILEGKQGAFKSSALAAIGGKWYAEINESLDSKDFYMVLQGKLLVEIGELDSFSKADVSTMKKVISTTHDRFRPPYGRAAMDFPRQSVFAGTTNEHAYLKDATGARRFWPVKVGKIELDLIRSEREQHFAEALHLLNSGASWWEVPEEAAKLEQDARYQTDEWEESVDEYAGKHDEIKIKVLAKDALKIEERDIDKPTQSRISNILKKLGWENKNVRVNGKQRWRWVKKNK